jgi:thiol-disulfide isomerase/thioredoxin
MRKFFLCLLCCAAISGTAPAYQKEIEYTGSLDPELVVDLRLYTIKLKAATDEDRSRLPQIAEGETVFAGQMRAAPSSKVKASAIFMIESADGKNPPYLYVDLDQDAKITRDERVDFEDVTEDNSTHKEATIKFPLAAGFFKSFPVLLAYFPAKKEAVERTLAQSISAYAEGKVDIAGRKTLVRYSLNQETGQVNPTIGQIGVDCDGDGKIDSNYASHEFAFARDETVVFRVEDRYVSAKSIDGTTGKIVFRNHPKSDYTRIEMRVGNEVPDFAFTDFDGRARRLSDFRGKYVMLDFWATWCGPCIVEIPNLKLAYEKYRSRGFEIIGLDQGESPERVKKFISQTGTHWTQATPESTRELAEKRFRIVVIPTTLLLDPQGKIISTGDGDLPLRGKDLIETLDRVLPAGK